MGILMRSNLASKEEVEFSNSPAKGRVSPHSLDAEYAVLGGVLLDNESLLQAVEILSADDFYRQGHKGQYYLLHI